MKRGILFYLLVCVLTCLAVSQGASSEETDLRIISWNLCYGFNHGNSVKEGIAWLNSQNPNVLGLQELKGVSAEELKGWAQRWGHENAVILKEKGFPVGLTSKRPITIVDKRIKGFHHGYLHCKTYGIHFFVVHFWAGKKHESTLVVEKVKSLIAEGKRVVVMGDFNAHSRKDKSFLITKELVNPRYGVVDKFENKGLVDLVHKHDNQALVSQPSPLIIPRWAKNIDEVRAKQKRIDFIFADSYTADFSASGTILRSKKLDQISDHYPVRVDLQTKRDTHF